MGRRNGTLSFDDLMHETPMNGSDMGGIVGEGQAGIGMDRPFEINQGLVLKALVIFGECHEVLEFPCSRGLVAVEGSENAGSFGIMAGVVKMQAFRECGLCRSGPPPCQS